MTSAPPTSGPSLRFNLLGPLEVEVDGVANPVGPPKQRTLLAALLISPGQVVSAERLVTELWPDEPPATATAALQVHVAGLRRIVGERLRTSGSGYQLLATEAEVDSWRFESLVSQARSATGAGPAAVAAGLRAALALWRGVAFEAVAGGPGVEAAATRLAELQLRVREDLAELELAQGRHREIVADLSAWAVQHPTAEGLLARLMLALHRSGRSSEALAAYDRFRTRLVAELAAEPEGEAAALAAAIRRGDPTIDAVHTNLPTQASRFIGRRRELDHAAALLGGCRLLTLTGPGGSGKTRLAVELAREVAAEYPDRVHMIEVAGHPTNPCTGSTAPADLAQAEPLAARMAAAIRAREAPGQSAVESLVSCVAERRMLLVVDNCEHVLGQVVALLDHLLASCPGVRILATSREPLGLDGEVVLPLAGLSLPDPDTPAESALRADAVRLLAERVSRARGGAGLRPDETSLAVDLCRRLDGLPLAIELAAARLRALSLHDVVSRLDCALDLLVGRSPLGRHRTMRAAIDWSHDLLDQVERTLFRRLSVFVGEFDLAAAQEVGADPDRGAPAAGSAVLDPLTRLVDRSLVWCDPAAERPYRLIETMREYAVEQLGRQDEYAAARRRHADFYARLVAPAPPMDGPAHAAWLAGMSAHHDNVRAALAWALGEGEDPELALSIATAMWWYWWVTGQMAEGRSWLRQALAAGGTEPSALRGRALRAAAALARNSGDLAEARRLGEEGLQVFIGLDDRAGIIATLNNLSITAQGQGDFEASLAYGYEGLRRADKDGPERAIAAALNNTAGTLRCLGRLDEATAMFTRGLEIFRGLADGRGEAAALTNLAVVARRRGELDESRRLAVRFLSLYWELEIAEGQLDGIEALAYVDAMAGRHAAALRLLSLAARERVRLGAPIFTPDEAADRDRAEQVARAGLDPSGLAEALAQAAADDLDGTVRRLLCQTEIQPGVTP
ncbi:MAG TPA: BTAD domain-containing putative transcriptional regulator [Micromonosporaceae bacterium]